MTTSFSRWASRTLVLQLVGSVQTMAIMTKSDLADVQKFQNTIVAQCWVNTIWGLFPRIPIRYSWSEFAACQPRIDIARYSFCEYRVNSKATLLLHNIKLGVPFTPFKSFNRRQCVFVSTRSCRKSFRFPALRCPGDSGKPFEFLELCRWSHCIHIGIDWQADGLWTRHILFQGKFGNS